MKRTTIATIANYIKDVPELAAEYAEVRAELDKNEAKAAANRELYDLMRDVVMSYLGDTPMTVAEIFTACKADLPEGATKNKIQYALSNYWTDEVVKDDNGKVNTYRRK